MTLHLNNPEIDKLARELAYLSGKPVEEVVLDALRKQSEISNAPAATQDASWEEILEIIHRFAALPTYDTRSPDEILYDENGLPR